ncbi:DUF1015 domain-containing protein [Trichlorobacter sp.]|jgi:hypothetical protein|uniref:DUF1015 domain-containing protein n=1 Tax=Trichlorobacter sp. TaxID=2911007 RepID=UPI002A366FD3|nr:DUF1015 domain-containing protein [Trichlorobacter sp.]MDY0385497.1 DUF1015 domain-containing protein [Trichlorobacter sp.]
MSAFSTIHVPNILLPKKGVDLTKFAVIACDQFTSQKEYWDQLDTLIGQSASTLRMIFPEAYLPLVDNQSYIKKINSTIENYLQENVLENIGPAFILVERSTPYTKRRLGLVIAIDLEDYSFQKGSQTLIRATEMTILERIPPRLKIREHAPVELPHTLVLYDDPDKNIIEKLYNERANLPLIYDFELNQDGGHLRGYKVSDTAAVIDAFEQLLAKKAEALLFVVGDGNHSLATAKAHWDKIKELLSEADKKNHPARYALVEVNNLYDEGINFAPIHRIVFNASEDFIPGLKSRLTGGQTGIIYTLKTGEIKQPMPKSGPQAYKIVQDYIDQYMQSHPQASVDYIHGRDHLYAVANKHPNAVAIAMPALSKSDLFVYIASDDVLPRKSFSLGEACEKRYYLECQKII